MATASGDPTHTQQNCSGCSKPSFNDGPTIACHQCRRWYHRACAGGVEEIADGSWSCIACILATSAPAKSIISTSSTRSARIRLEMMRLEEIQKANEKHMLERQELERLREERTQKEKEDLTKKFIDKKYALLMSEALEDGASSVRSRGSRGSRQRSLDKVKHWMEVENREISGIDTTLGDLIISPPPPQTNGNQRIALSGTPLTLLGTKVATDSDLRQTTETVPGNCLPLPQSSTRSLLPSAPIHSVTSTPHLITKEPQVPSNSLGMITSRFPTTSNASRSLVPESAIF